MATPFKEFFKTYYATGHPFTIPIQQEAKNHLLFAQIKDWASTGDRTLVWLSEIVEKYNTKSIHPDKLIEILENMGFYTVEEILSFAEAVNKTSFWPSKIYNYLNPKLDRHLFTKTINYIDVWNLMRVKIPALFHDTNNKLALSDSTYLLVSDPQYVLDKCPSDRFKFVSESFDCDDFTRVVKGWLSEQRLGNLAVGEVVANLFKDGQFVGAHSFLIMLCEPKLSSDIFDIYWADGQGDNDLWKLGEDVASTWSSVYDSFDVRKINL
jgi:hypothetical protein